MSSKLSFRARALDATKALPIYHAEDIPDLADFATINRTVPQMPTGMEKEEENEKHLVMAMTTQQLQGQTGDTIIPTPNVSTNADNYDEVYQRDAHRSVQYIRMSGLCVEEEPPSYDMDTEDEEWLNAQSRDRPLSPQHFESMMDKLEQGSGNTVLSEPEAHLLLKDNPDLVLAVYDYWLSKRLRAGGALIPAIKQEKKDGTYTSNPYIAFRKRTEKMQTRKNRKNDEQAYMQMVKLRRDLVRACSLAQLVKDREEAKQAIAQAAKDIFMKRYDLADWSGSILAQCAHESLRVPTSLPNNRSVQPAKQATDWDSTQEMVDDDGTHMDRLASYKKKRYKKKYFFQRENATTLTPDEVSQELFPDRESSYDREDDEPDGVFTFRRRQHVKYYMPQTKLGCLPWEGHSDDAEYSSYAKRYRFCRATLSGSDVGLARRRFGRGGRITWDCVTAYGSRTVSGASSDEEANSEMDTPAVQANNRKCLHFASRSPSPSDPNPLLPHIGPQPPNMTNSAGSCFSNLPTSQFSLKAVTQQLGYTSDCKMHSPTATVTTCTSSLNCTSPAVSTTHVGGGAGSASGTCLLTPVDAAGRSHAPLGAATPIDHSRMGMGGHTPRTDDHLSCVSMATTTPSNTLTTQHATSQHGRYHDNNSNVLTMTGPPASILRLNRPIKSPLLSHSVHTPFLPPRGNSYDAHTNLERTKSSTSSSQSYTDSNHSLYNSVMDSTTEKSSMETTRNQQNTYDDSRQLKQALAAVTGNASTTSCYNHTNFSSNPTLVSRGEVT